MTSVHTKGFVGRRCIPLYPIIEQRSVGYISRVEVSSGLWEVFDEMVMEIMNKTVLN